MEALVEADTTVDQKAAPEPKEASGRDYTCPICTDTVIEPITVKCGHTFCDDCLRALSSHNGHTNGKCPVCNKAIGDIKDYGVNIMLRDTLIKRGDEAYARRLTERKALAEHNRLYMQYNGSARLRDLVSNIRACVALKHVSYDDLLKRCASFSQHEVDYALLVAVNNWGLVIHNNTIVFHATNYLSERMDELSPEDALFLMCHIGDVQQQRPALCTSFKTKYALKSPLRDRIMKQPTPELYEHLKTIKHLL